MKKLIILTPIMALAALALPSCTTVVKEDPATTTTVTESSVTRTPATSTTVTRTGAGY